MLTLLIMVQMNQREKEFDNRQKFLKKSIDKKAKTAF